MYWNILFLLIFGMYFLLSVCYYHLMYLCLHLHKKKILVILPSPQRMGTQIPISLCTHLRSEFPEMSNPVLQVVTCLLKIWSGSLEVGKPSTSCWICLSP